MNGSFATCLQASKPGMFLGLLCSSVSFVSFARHAEQCDAVRGNNRSSFLGTKPHSLCQALQLQARLVTACFVAKFSCCVLRWNI